jgi:hypothetical protein
LPCGAAACKQGTIASTKQFFYFVVESCAALLALQTILKNPISLFKAWHLSCSFLNETRPLLKRRKLYLRPLLNAFGKTWPFRKAATVEQLISSNHDFSK